MTAVKLEQIVASEALEWSDDKIENLQRCCDTLKTVCAQFGLGEHTRDVSNAWVVLTRAQHIMQFASDSEHITVEDMEIPKETPVRLWVSDAFQSMNLYEQQAFKEDCEKSVTVFQESNFGQQSLFQGAASFLRGLSLWL